VGGLHRTKPAMLKARCVAPDVVDQVLHFCNPTV
jgi:hypothetical protein